jgi:hypothetical protein
MAFGHAYRRLRRAVFSSDAFDRGTPAGIEQFALIILHHGRKDPVALPVTGHFIDVNE